MDIYEALKQGTDPAKLRETFDKEMKEAQHRLAAEKKEAKDAASLDQARSALVEALAKYSSLLNHNNDAAAFKETAEAMFKDFEERNKTLLELTQMMNDFAKEGHEDAKAIRDFVDSFF